jgi:hypothetical protein
MEGKVRGGTRCRGDVRVAAVSEGGSERGFVLRRWCWGRRTRRCRASGKAREGEKGEERAGDADATVHNKLKRDNWNGYKMDKF